MKYDEDYIQSLDLNNTSENNSKPQKNGLFFSIVSLLLYTFTFLPYIVVVAQGLIEAFILNKTVYGFGLFLGIFGAIVFLPSLLSCIYCYSMAVWTKVNTTF